nr:bifunctional diguanylate cyclase/phosphodiesterase [Campylobacterota bacterium]
KFFEVHYKYISTGIIFSVLATLYLNSTQLTTSTFIMLLVLLFSYILYYLKRRQYQSTIDSDNIKIQNLQNHQKHIENSGYYATLNESFHITYANRIFTKDYAQNSRNLLGAYLFEVLHISPKSIIQEVQKNGSFKGIVESTKENQKQYQSIVIQPLSDLLSKEYFIICNNVTDSIKSDQELKAQFMIDKFTGLSTKTKLIDDIEESKSKTTLHLYTLIYVKIDAFSEINEFFGIDAGNKILSYVASWLSKELPTRKAKLYKLDLDTFAIYTTQRLGIDTLEDYLKKISSNVEKENFYFKDTAVNISFTLGAARSKTDMIKCAYLALKDASNLRKSYKIYDKSCAHEERFIKNIKMNQMIKDAIIENRVVPFFQPIYNLKTNKIEKFESLIRIQSRNNTYLAPAEFLEVAKKSKLYLELSRSMIKSSFDKLESINIPITINISMDDILDKKVSNFILRKLTNTGKGKLITFEIVESQEIESHVKIANFIKKVKALGCKVAIDDFGSGYSNFEQLLKLDIDYLKIDGSLIKDIDTNKESEIVTRSIISFAKELGIKTIAEFVSTEAVFKKVKRLGVDYAQGYHIGKPSSSLSFH